MLSLLSESNPILFVREIHKRFPGVHALKGVDFDVRAGEIHALIGENGAGKSTLMQILAGVYLPDSGSITFDGQSQPGFSNEKSAQDAGIAIVFQERSLFGPLSIAENILAGRQPTNRFGIIDYQRLRSETTSLLSRVGLKVDVDLPVESLAPAEQQLVEIAKALSLNAKLLILDEPTAALTPKETEILFEVMRSLKQQGVALIYISHRLEEVFQIADRVTVLKDGEKQGTFLTSEVTPSDLIRKMVGREVEFERPKNRQGNLASKIVLEVRHLHDVAGRGRIHLQDIQFQVHEGEILGLAGLVGAGRTETALAIFGARRESNAEIWIEGEKVTIRNPFDSIEAGIGYVPEDRKEAGLFLDMGIARNIASVGQKQFGSWIVSDCKQEQVAEEFRKSLKIVSRGGDEAVRNLSGGNQQKILLARWLLVKPKVLMVDEPTRGVDVGAKREVHSLLFELARQGTAIIVISSDLPEVLALADRVIVLREGRQTGELSREEMSEENIIRLASLGKTGS
jgi:ABC-type sugar transport system ATPase subunit